MNCKTILASALLLSAIPASAGTTMPSLDEPQLTTTTDSGWRVGTSMYVWTTRLDGEMTIRGTTVPVDVPFDKIFDNLKFTFMGLVEVGKGRWSFMSDIFYARLEPSVSTQRADFNSQIEQFIGNFAVFYNVAKTSTTRFDVFGGARVNWMETDVDIDFQNGDSFSDSGEKPGSIPSSASASITTSMKSGSSAVWQTSAASGCLPISPGRPWRCSDTISTTRPPPDSATAPSAPTTPAAAPLMMSSATACCWDSNTGSETR